MKPPKPIKTKLRGDWSYWKGNVFVKYTWRHRIRLLIELNGKMPGGDYVFKRVRYGSRLHRILNYFLATKSRSFKARPKVHHVTKKGTYVSKKGTRIPVRPGDTIHDEKRPPTPTGKAILGRVSGRTSQETKSMQAAIGRPPESAERKR